MKTSDSPTTRRTVLRNASLAVGAATLGIATTSGTAAASIQCPKTPGYWKNHTEQPNCVKGFTGDVGDCWPARVGYLNLGYDVDDETEKGISASTAIEILNTPPRGDKSIIMAQHLIAALLNRWFHADVTCITNWKGEVNWLARAQNWMSTHQAGTGVRKWDGGEEIKDMLDRYNNGTLSCPSDCP